MSLRYQIIGRIVLLSLGILLLGGAIAIWQARQAVAKEVDASLSLAVQLITLGIHDVSAKQPIEDLSRFASLKQTRHLSIHLRKADGQQLHFSGETQPSDPEQMPPAWFVRWVSADYPQLEQQLTASDGQQLTLIIQAQPLDEITEVWQESLGFFASISLLIVLSFLAVNLVFNRALYSIVAIVDALRLIEAGRYGYRLPRFATREFDDIAKAVNHLSGELETAYQQNQALTQHSLVIQEEERQRLSQELHDEFGQSLTAIKVMAVAANRPLADTGKISSGISEICNHLMLVLRSMMQQLHPLVLSELGLKAALEDMLEHWAERNPELVLQIQCGEVVELLDKHQTIQVFRVIQECLTNVIRHAGAKQMRIDLQQVAAGFLLLTVKDDGVGCDLQQIHHGFGLLGIKERIRSLNGELAIFSRPDQGMTISARIPLP